MTTYAVTGSTGHLGRLVVQELLARGVPATDVVALARTRDRTCIDVAEIEIEFRTRQSRVCDVLMS